MCFSATKNILLLSLRSKRFRSRWSRKLGGESKKRGMSPEGEGRKENLPLSLFFHFFCSRSNFGAISRCETLATQANYYCLARLAHRLPAVSRPEHVRISSFLGGCKHFHHSVSKLPCNERSQSIKTSLVNSTSPLLDN